MSVNKNESFTNADPRSPTFLTDSKNSDFSPRRSRGPERARLELAQNEFSKVIENLDTRIFKILSKQEQEYITSFRYYVSQKEDEIQKLTEKLRKDEELARQKESNKIKQLESYSEVKKKEAEFLAELCKDSNKETLKWKSKVLNLSNDCTFLDKKIREVMKENKIMKFFIIQIEQFLSKQLQNTEKSEIFIKNIGNLLSGVKKFNHLENLSFIEESLDFFNTDGIFKTEICVDGQNNDSSITKKIASATLKKKSHLRSNSIQIENTNNDFANINIMQETQKALHEYEQKANGTIGLLKKKIEKQQKENSELKRKLAKDHVRENDLEQIFLNCVQHAKKEMYKRRLKSMQTPGKKHIFSTDNSSSNNNNYSRERSEEEEDLSQIELLCRFSAIKDKGIGFENFTAADKYNILRLFLDNEYAIQKIYETMFPSRASEYEKIKEPFRKSELDTPGAIEEELTFEKNSEKNTESILEKKQFSVPKNPYKERKSELPRLKQYILATKPRLDIRTTKKFKTHLNASLSINQRKISQQTK